jgi:tetratricopeptide (TPR) repeat protein/TolB-like protein
MREMAEPERPLGQTISHYRIREKIGAGGMGEVYRAHDEQLDRDIALKVLPRGTIADDAARKQFRKEALALAKLNHPNIATVFEFSSQDGVDFLAMELIAGHPLSDKLLGGPLSQPDIFRLGTQLAEGLAAAHEQGIIHRDLKPANLFVTPDGRLKILDFGLAKSVSSTLSVDVTQSTVFGEGAISGTLPYMSPEQLRGLPVDPRSDIYAAGAVLYEMATGTRPFPQTQGAELMGAILHRSPPAPRTVNPHVSAALENIVSKALEKDPAQRYQSARELRVALDGLSGGSSAEAEPRRDAEARDRTVLMAGAALLAAILVAGVLFGLNFHELRDRILGRSAADVGNGVASSSSIKARRSVAVVGFTNVSGRADKAWVSTALSEMLTTELAAGSQLRTIPGENIAKMKMSLALADAESYGRDTLQKIRSNLSADTVVVGSYVTLGNDQIRLDVRLQDAVSGDTLASLSEKGSDSEIDDLVSRAGAELRAKLGAAAVTQADAASVKASLPSGAEAARLYSEGLTKLRARDALAARDLLEKAVAAEPDFALGRAALAGAWQTLGYDAKAAAEAKTAFDLSSGLGREDRLAIEGRYREATQDWNKAIDVYRTLWQFSPDNLEYGLRLASTQDLSGKFGDALDTLRQLRHLPAPESDDPRIDLEEATADASLARWKDGVEVSARAVSKAQASGARLVVASALARQGECLHYLGEFDKADAVFKEAQLIYTEAGDRFGVAGALTGLATDAYQRGDLKSARTIYEQSLTMDRDIGSERDAATVLGDIAMTFYDQGDLARAKEMYQQALTAKRTVDDKSGIANSLNSIGNVLADEGDQAGARKAYRDALKVFRESGDKFAAAMTMGNLASLLADEGNLREAKQMFEEALEIKRSLHNRHSEAYTASNLGDLLLVEGDLAGARKMHEDALAIRTDLGERATAREERRDLAEISLEEGKPADALAAARQVADAFHADHQRDYEATAYALAARCLLALGKPDAAAIEIQKAEDLSAKSDDKIVTSAIAVTRGRILTASGDSAGARKKLEGVLAAAARSGLMQWQLEARLAIGELEMKSGKVTAGRARLTGLEKEATAKSYLLIARKAKAARK